MVVPASVALACKGPLNARLATGVGLPFLEWLCWGSSGGEAAVGSCAPARHRSSRCRVPARQAASVPVASLARRRRRRAGRRRQPTRRAATATRVRAVSSGCQPPAATTAAFHLAHACGPSHSSAQPYTRALVHPRGPLRAPTWSSTQPTRSWAR